MNGQNNDSSKYPAGYIEYAFEMHATFNEEISIKYGHTNVTKLVLKKENLSVIYDPKWLMTIHFGPVSSIDEVDETGNKIKDDIFNMLSFTLNKKIARINRVGHGIAPRPGEGAICHGILPGFSLEADVKVSCPILSGNDIDEVQDYIIKTINPQHKSYINLYRYAIGADDPVVQFLNLYTILYLIYENQKDIDRQIISLDPNTPQSIRPKSSKPETIYTKLRNELNHRADRDPEETKVEIMNNQVSFKKIVHDILKQMV